jgi:hypothetical protein
MGEGQFTPKLIMNSSFFGGQHPPQWLCLEKDFFSGFEGAA